MLYALHFGLNAAQRQADMCTQVVICVWTLMSVKHSNKGSNYASTVREACLVQILQQVVVKSKALKERTKIVYLV